MGLPSLNIEFIKKAKEVINKSANGVVLLLLKDNTATQIVNSYEELEEVNKSEYTDRNYLYIRLAFLGKPKKVIVVRGVINSSNLDLEASKKLIENLNYDWLAIPEIKANEVESFTTWFKTNREKKNKKSKAVLADAVVNMPFIVNFATNKIKALIDSNVVEFSKSEYTARIAGLLAGTSLSNSSTYKIFDEIVDIEFSTDENADVDSGKFIIIFDGDKFKVARGVTSLTSPNEKYPDDLKKIKVVEAIDIIKNDILNTFSDMYVGKKNNNYDNKIALVGAIYEYFKSIEGVLIDKDYKVDIDVEANKEYLKKKNIDVLAMSKQEIKEANTGSNVFLVGNIKVLDAMEDFNFKLNL